MLKILWKRGEIAPEEQFLLLSTIFCYRILDFYVKTRIRFSLRDNRSRDEGRLYLNFGLIVLYTYELNGTTYKLRNKDGLMEYSSCGSVPACTIMCTS